MDKDVISTADPDPDGEQTEAPNEWDALATTGHWIGMGVTALVCAFVVGLLAGVLVSQWVNPLVGFFPVSLGAFIWLVRKPIPSAAVGDALTFTALELLLIPVVVYVPELTGGDSLVGLTGVVIGGIIFALVATAVAGVGWFFRRRSQRKLEMT